MKKRILPFLIIMMMIILIPGCGNSPKKATYINMKPSIIIGDVEYIVTNDVVSEDELEKQIGKVTEIKNIVTHDPKFEENYANPSKIYKIKNKNIEDVVALKTENKIYIVKPNQ